MHAVIAVSAATDNTTLYYNHWEDGYDFDPLNPSTADEGYTLAAGAVQEFQSSNIPISPRGTAFFYDGQDRIYTAGGAVTVTRASWPESVGSVFALAWEVYPTKPFLSSYVIPVGEDLAGAPTNYNDFDRVYVLVQSTTDGNVIEIDDPTTAGVELSVTLNKGETAQLYSINAGTTVTSTAPVQVQFIVGQAQNGGLKVARGYTAVPDNLWGTEYYNPVGGFASGDTDLYLYNPGTAAITVNFEDSAGLGSFVIPAGDTIPYQDGAGRLVPQNSGVYLSSADVFWGIGSADTESATYDWGFSLVPVSLLDDSYLLCWAPGSSDIPPADNGSPLFVSPIADGTIFYVDFSPADGVVDETFTLNRLETRKIFDPDDDNSQMRVWATNQFAAVWGQDPDTAGLATPYLDLGYTTLPLREEFMDLVLRVQKSAAPATVA